MNRAFEHGSADWIMLTNVLSSSLHPAQFCLAIGDYLKPTGRVVLLDWKVGQPAGPEADRRVDSEQAIRMLTDCGMIFERTLNTPGYHYGLVFQAGVRVREIELQIRRAGISAQQQEADEVIRVTTEQIRELETKKLLTPEIRAELELRVRSAEAKKLDAQAGEVAAKVTEKEIDLLKRNSVALDQNTSSRERNTKSKLDQNGLDAQGRNADGLRPSTSPDSLSPSLDTRNNNRLVSPELTYDKDKFATNPDGSRITGGTNLPKPPGDGWDWVAELNQGWPYGGYWKRGSEIYSGTPGNSPVNRDGLFNRPFGGFGLLTANPGSGTFRFDGSPEPYQSQALGSGFRPATPASTTPPIPAASAPTAQTSNHTVTINIGGRPTTINTATAGDADALVSLLTQLEDAAGRGG
jgi:hypothetical protein